MTSERESLSVIYEKAPKHEAEIKPEALAKVLEQIIEARRELARMIQTVTNPRHSIDGGAIESMLRSPMARIQFADGMVEALDLLAPISDGTSWGAYTKLAAEEEISAPDVN
jgi:hypothetical protein